MHSHHFNFYTTVCFGYNSLRLPKELQAWHVVGFWCGAFIDCFCSPQAQQVIIRIIVSSSNTPTSSFVLLLLLFDFISITGVYSLCIAEFHSSLILRTYH
jgi:hypothetical protein